MSEQQTQRRVTPTAVRVLPADADRELWLAERRRGIGSSDVAAILGAADYATAVHVYRDKRGQLVDDAGEAAMWGHLLEDVVAREWARRQKSVIQRVGLVANADTPWMMTTLDRLVLECPMDRSVSKRCALEVKCRSAFKAHRWHADIPDDVLAQTAWQRLVTGFDHIHVAVLIGGNEMKLATAFADPKVDDYVLTQVRRFRDEHLLPGVEPDWDLTKAQALIDMDSLMNSDRVGEIDLSDVGEVIEYAARSAAKSRAEKALKESSATLRRLANGALTVTFGGELAYEYGPVTKSSCDLERLADRWPEAYADCVTSKTHYAIRLAKEFKQ
ncbi:lambda-exonuclease family protein [Actinoplanes sp. NPDC051470]|uniref:YqaJ viral recombinase family nuclease n=1 Tax=Actinoplanes sp. NPDC051470 TaxID=3157224 RepID=UPI0034255C93